MSNKVIIEIDGQSVELDTELLKGYREEAFEYLKEEQEQKTNFKSAVESQSEALGIDKKIWSKYLKASYKAKTKEASALGTVFAALDEATEESIAE